MSIVMLYAISPQLILSFGIVISLLVIAWQRSQRVIQLVTQVIFICALLANLNLLAGDALKESITVTSLLLVDGYSAFAFMLILFSSLVVVNISRDVLNDSIEVHDEYYVLIQLVTLGASILIISEHFASLFLGFEMLSIGLVGLVGYIRDNKYSVETGFKYLILSATASSFMLLGIAFIYSQTGVLSFSRDVAESYQFISQTSSSMNQFYSVGVLLFFVGIAFKLSLVPFHFWSPDIYQGAPTPIVMLLATVSKVSMFVVLMKCWFSIAVFSENNIYQQGLHSLIIVVAILSMLAGNILALKQTNLKRLLGYSSIAHMGYLLIVLVVSSDESIQFAWQSALVYLAGYVLANLSIFVAIALSQKKVGMHAELEIVSWNGLFWRNKSIAILLLISLLSLAGIPLSIGFIGKFYLLSHATNMHQWWLISSLILGSGIGLIYYLRVVFALFYLDDATVRDNDNGNASMEIAVMNIGWVKQMLVLLLTFFSLILGVFPDGLAHLINSL